MAYGRGRRMWHEFWTLAALCLLTASRWLVEGAFPETSSTRLSEAVGCAMAAAGFAGATAAVRRRSRASRSDQTGVRLVTTAGAALVLLGPVLSEVISGRHVSASSATLALALVPVVVGVGASVSETAWTGDLSGLLWPGLAGLMGLLLLLPEPSLTGWRSWTGLLALPTLIGVGGCFFGGLQSTDEAARPSAPSFSGFWALTLAGAVFGALSFGVRRSGGGGSFGWSAAGLDGVSALLTLVSLRRLRAVRWSSQFLLVPFLGLVEGLVFLRPILDVRSWVGLGLVAVGALYQLTLSRSGQAGVPSLLATESVSGR